MNLQSSTNHVLINIHYIHRCERVRVQLIAESVNPEILWQYRSSKHFGCSESMTELVVFTIISRWFPSHAVMTKFKVSFHVPEIPTTVIRKQFRIFRKLGNETMCTVTGDSFRIECLQCFLVLSHLYRLFESNVLQRYIRYCTLFQNK